MAIDCSKCPERASCCGVFQMEKEWVEKHKDKFQVTPVKIVEGDTKIAFLTEDLACVFLNRKTKLCIIYEDRPLICRMYGETNHPDLQCPYFKRSGNPRSEASRKKCERHFNKLWDKIEGFAKREDLNTSIS